MSGIERELENLQTTYAEIPIHADETALPVSRFEVSDDWLLNEATDVGAKNAMQYWWSDRFRMAAFNSIDTSQDFDEVADLYDPLNTLQTRFGECVSLKLIREVAEEINSIYKYWHRKPLTEAEQFNKDFAVFVDDMNSPLNDLRERLYDLKELCGRSDSVKADVLIKNMAFVAAITALETFLYETMIFWVTQRDGAVRGIITGHPTFKLRDMKLGDIYRRQDGLRTEILAYMQNMVWHRFEDVHLLFKFGLGLQKLDFQPFIGALLKRHDIVHRSGYTHTKVRVEISGSEIDQLLSVILAFGEMINSAALHSESDLTPF